jgi:3-oxoacyl-[acyl-carrier-protein] synthase III
LTNEATIKTKKFIKKKPNDFKNGCKEKHASKRKIDQQRRKTNEIKKCMPKQTNIKTKKEISVHKETI